MVDVNAFEKIKGQKNIKKKKHNKTHVEKKSFVC